MESVIRMSVLFGVISLCVGYFGEYISKDLVLEKRLELEKKKQEAFTDIIEEDEKKPKNRIVYLDIVIKDFMTDDRTVRVFIELFFDKVPKTARNFYEICKKNKYAGVPFHRIISGFMIQGGDITNYDGTGGKSIYGKEFNDENFRLKHNSEGLLSMANKGPNTNSSQFFITLGACPHLDGKHVVFGRVIEGMEHVRNIGTSPTDFSDRPLQDVLIIFSGEKTPDAKKKIKV
tara:strand:- start:36317 stop:37012 length:696 start_codon:yes stop_codon:yes gene_type:complete